MDDERAAPPWAAPPDGVVPGVAATSVIIGRSPETVVALTSLRCYPDGVELLLTVRTRRPDRDVLDRAVNIDNPGRLDWAIRHHRGSGARPHYFADRPDGPTIVPRSGYGTDTKLDLNFWLWPLPGPSVCGNPAPDAVAPAAFEPPSGPRGTGPSTARRLRSDGTATAP